MPTPPQPLQLTINNAPAFLYLPQNPAPQNIPWVLYSPGQGFSKANHHILEKLLDQNIALASINLGESAGAPASIRTLHSFYQLLTTQHHLAKKPVLWPQSRGGLTLYNFAADHPECVQAIAGTYTVCNLAEWATSAHPRIQELYAQARQAYELTPEQFLQQLPNHNPIDRLAFLAKARIPILHIHGDSDVVVPLEPHALELSTRYKALNAPAQLLIIPNKGHEECPEFFHNETFINFMIAQAKASTNVAQSPHQKVAQSPPAVID